MLAYYLHNLNPLIFRLWDDVGPRWYGLAYVLAFICGYVLLRVLAKLGYADLSPVKVGDFITGCALFGVIVGGRLGYVFFYKTEMLREPLSLSPKSVTRPTIAPAGGLAQFEPVPAC